jgi:hypothetical protein
VINVELVDSRGVPKYAISVMLGFSVGDRPCLHRFLHRVPNADPVGDSIP